MPGNDEHISIEFEDGSVRELLNIGVFDAEDREYIALLDEDTEEVYLYRYVEPDDSSYDIEEIETDEEFEIAAKVWDEIIGADEEDE